MKTTIEVEITNIQTDTWYYSFDYKIWVDGKLKYQDKYDNDHSYSDGHEAFGKRLRDGYAVKLALERSF